MNTLQKLKAKFLENMYNNSSQDEVMEKQENYIKALESYCTKLEEDLELPNCFDERSCLTCISVANCTLAENVKHHTGMKLREMLFYCYVPRYTK